MWIDSYWRKWQTKCSKLGPKDVETSEVLQETWNRYVMLWFVSAHLPWNAISKLELGRSYKTVRDHLVLLSAANFGNICWRDYALTVDAIKKQMPSRNKVSKALDRWTSTNKHAITSVSSYYMDQNWALREVQLAFKDVDRLFLSTFER